MIIFFMFAGDSLFSVDEIIKNQALPISSEDLYTRGDIYLKTFTES